MDHVLVEVYYESMCPDSKYFIRQQLVPVMDKIPEIVDFRLIPYGKANVFMIIWDAFVNVVYTYYLIFL